MSMFSQPAEAAKVLPQSKSAKTQSMYKAPSATSLTVYPRLRRDRLALLMNFGNLTVAQSVSYMLYYKTNGQDEGVAGSVSTQGQSTAYRELLFGTCSKNVCRYHYNITDMRLEISAELKNGKKILRKYRIKV